MRQKTLGGSCECVEERPLGPTDKCIIELLLFHCTVCCVVVKVCVYVAKDICLRNLLLLLATHIV